MNMRAKRADRSGIFSGTEPKRAIIDIGSNTVRLVVYGGNMRAPTVLLNEKVAARLGRDIADTGALADEAVDLAMRGLERYALLLDELGVSDVETVATAASRDAKNGAEFIARVESLGLNPQLISGAEEAALSASGVLGAFPGAEGTVADLGGGSLELVRIGDGASGVATSLPLGTLRLAERCKGKPADVVDALAKDLEAAGWGEPVSAPLYLVGGTWRAMATYAMLERDYPLSDPHGFELSGKKAVKLAERLASMSPADLRALDRISSMRSASMPNAALLLQAILKTIEPTRLVFSSWGIREGLLYDRLESHEKTQDPMLAGVANFAAQRGAPAQLATRIAGWTAGVVPSGSERLRLAAIMLSLASMQIEPNVRPSHVVDWALHKRWIALDPRGRAMLAVAIAANGNRLDLAEKLSDLASKDDFETAVSWGLATRFARRIGARSPRSFQVTRLSLDSDKLVLSLAESHKALFGVPNEKDIKLLADRLGVDWELRIVGEEELLFGDDTSGPD